MSHAPVKILDWGISIRTPDHGSSAQRAARVTILQGLREMHEVRRSHYDTMPLQGVSLDSNLIPEEKLRYRGKMCGGAKKKVALRSTGSSKSMK